MLIQKYNTKWVEDFNQIKSILHKTISNINIEHIGSTSIPELAAKPIIDIDIVFDTSIDFEEIKKGLESIGYYHNGNQGIPKREAFKRNLTIEKHKVLDFITHHLYVCPIDSEELERHLLFRDYLTNNETARMQYQELKYEIAKKVNQDKKEYAQLKEVIAKDFFESIIEKARKNEQ